MSLCNLFPLQKFDSLDITLSFKACSGIPGFSCGMVDGFHGTYLHRRLQKLHAHRVVHGGLVKAAGKIVSMLVLVMRIVENR